MAGPERLGCLRTIRNFGIVNHHLRSNPNVKDVELNVVITTAKDLVMPMNIDYDNEKQVSCKQECDECL